MPTATSWTSTPAAAADSAILAAPVRSGSSIPDEWLIPSGKTHTASPLDSAASTAANDSALRWTSAASCLRYTGIAPEARISGPSGPLKSVDLARNRTGRPAVAITSAGSSSALG